MAKHVLITGGAGFIGSHLCDLLLENGFRVKVLDNLSEQVHGKDCIRPLYLDDRVELIRGDIHDKSSVEKALNQVDLVYHFAAKVGVGQSMYEIADYVNVNDNGTAILLEAIIKRPVEKLIVASSMSIYGEGLYEKPDGKVFHGKERNIGDLKKGIWELPLDHNVYLRPIPTTEEKTPSLSSVYALTKYNQERLCLITGRAYKIPVVALRFFNVYGTRQALSNPYTGVLAIFASRYLSDNPPIIYEDGNQRRDFVNVKDVVQACLLAGIQEEANGQVLNIGSGNAITIREIAHLLAEVMNKTHIHPEINFKYRVGDIRHCFADISKARKILGYEPSVEMRNGLLELADWLKTETVVDNIEMAGKELDKRGLTIS